MRSTIPDCPGLHRDHEAGVLWLDSTAKPHDLTSARMLTFDEVAANPLVSDLGYGTSGAVSELVRSGRLYPVFRKNDRVIRVFECAVPDFRRRVLR